MLECWWSGKIFRELPYAENCPLFYSELPNKSVTCTLCFRVLVWIFSPESSWSWRYGRKVWRGRKRWCFFFYFCWWFDNTEKKIFEIKRKGIKWSYRVSFILVLPFYFVFFPWGPFQIEERSKGNGGKLKEWKKGCRWILKEMYNKVKEHTTPPRLLCRQHTHTRTRT